jgi:hypothetical protein
VLVHSCHHLLRHPFQTKTVPVHLHDRELHIPQVKSPTSPPTNQNHDPAEASIMFDNLDPSAFQQVIDTISIRPLRVGVPNSTGGGYKIIWNIYATPPSNSPQRHQEWRRSVSTLKFVTALNGAGTAEPPTSCYGCKSIDHTTGLCPFPSTPRWVPPPLRTVNETPTSLTQALETSQKTRSGRGRGNARGCSRGRGHARGSS